MKGIMKVLLLMAVVTASGCAVHMTDVKSDMAQGQGVTQIVNCDTATAHDTAKSVLQGNKHFDAVQDDGTALFAVGNRTVFGVQIKKIDATHTEIVAVSKRKNPTLITTDMSEDEFFKAFNALLENSKK